MILGIADGSASRSVSSATPRVVKTIGCPAFFFLYPLYRVNEKNDTDLLSLTVELDPNPIRSGA